VIGCRVRRSRIKEMGSTPQWEGVVEEAVIGLAAAIEGLRSELMAAVAEGRDQQMQFRLEPVELTAQVAATKEANGKIGWKIFGLGGSYETAATQTLTIRLAPVWKSDDGTLTTDFTIAAITSAGDRIGPRTPSGAGT
jgi:Trypsin-co-occurring domain 2